MESKIQSFKAFQIYSIGKHNIINLMVDHLLIQCNRIFFRVTECLELNKKLFKKEHGNGIYSMIKEDLLSIRCRFYF
jgi:hypothetical protein